MVYVSLSHQTPAWHIPVAVLHVCNRNCSTRTMYFALPMQDKNVLLAHEHESARAGSRQGSMKHWFTLVPQQSGGASAGSAMELSVV